VNRLTPSFLNPTLHESPSASGFVVHAVFSTQRLQTSAHFDEFWFIHSTTTPFLSHRQSSGLSSS
jgi:hypothetical protein